MHLSILFIALALLVSNINCDEPDCSKPPNEIKRAKCCPSGRFPTTKEIREKCNFPDRPHKEKPECDAVKCIFQELKLVDGSGKVNQGAFKKYMEGKLPAEWKPIISKSLTTCIKEASSNPGECEIRKFFNCFRRSLFVNCPGSIWQSTPDCDNLKNYIATCRMPASG